METPCCRVGLGVSLRALLHVRAEGHEQVVCGFAGTTVYPFGVANLLAQRFGDLCGVPVAEIIHCQQLYNGPESARQLSVCFGAPEEAGCLESKEPAYSAHICSTLSSQMQPTP